MAVPTLSHPTTPRKTRSPALRLLIQRDVVVQAARFLSLALTALILGPERAA